MRSELKIVKAIRLELDKYQSPTGLAMWIEIIRTWRVAGEPRSVSTARKAMVLADMIADQKVPDSWKEPARKELVRLKNCAAMKEVVWLDQTKFRRFLLHYRAKDYREAAVGRWSEDHSKSPYRREVPALVWKLITARLEEEI